MRIKLAPLGVLLLALLALGLRAQADVGVAWKTFTDPENRFSILMPTDPQVSSDSGPAGAAKPSYTSRIYIAREGANIYLAGITLYDVSSYNPSETSETIEKELAADRDNFNKQVKAHGTDGHRRQLDGHPALEFKSSAPQGNFSGLVVLVGSHCYMVVAAYRTPDEPAEATKFLKSFKLITP
ncbi:MAG: hypothetical protein KGJ37_00410 [Verrucomicrobiota bacterium]|nr:hypothetical protein [Verrucomicrobiota bacterium]